MAKKKEIDDTLFNSINEQDIVFPLYYKNRYNTVYCCMQNEEKFEQLTISKKDESFRGCILFGFNEQLVDMQKDIKLWYHAILRTHKLIDGLEYEAVFNAILEGRQEFFMGNSYNYIEKELPVSQEDLNKRIKHKWKTI